MLFSLRRNTLNSFWLIKTQQSSVTQWVGGLLSICRQPHLVGFLVNFLPINNQISKRIRYKHICQLSTMISLIFQPSNIFPKRYRAFLAIRSVPKTVLEQFNLINQKQEDKIKKQLKELNYLEILIIKLLRTHLLVTAKSITWSIYITLIAIDKLIHFQKITEEAFSIMKKMYSLIPYDIDSFITTKVCEKIVNINPETLH